MSHLKGIQVDSYIHPDEKKAWKLITGAVWLKAFLSWAGSIETRIILKAELLGSAVEASEEKMPELYKNMYKACEVLDYDKKPRIFIVHSSALRTRIFYDDTPLIIVPDYMLGAYDSDMMLFEMGRCVTHLKKEQCQTEMLLLNSVPLLSRIPGVGSIAVPIVCSWIRKAELTADRGGLLACQEQWTAEKTLMRNAGVPAELISRDILPEYHNKVKDISFITGLAQGLKQLNKLHNLNNDRILEIARWYSSGEYSSILKKYGCE